VREAVPTRCIRTCRVAALEMIEQLSLDATDTWVPLPESAPMTVEVVKDHLTEEAVRPFDYEFTGRTTFHPAGIPTQLPTDFGIGVIVGASGSGKSTMLRSFGKVDLPEWASTLAIAAHFGTAAEASRRFAAVGLNAVPTWGKPYRVLSNGERFRADLARRLEHGATVDEFTSVVDRNVAVSVSKAVRRYVQDAGIKRLVLATCHRDVLPWLEPDWVIDLDIRAWALRPRECLQRADLMVEVYAGTTAAWDVFRRHHYLSGDIAPGARCFVAVMNGELVGFAAAIAFPNGYLKNAWRGHRTVILPDFQGMGLGVRLSDFVARLHVAEGKRYFSRTAHPRMNNYRAASPEWRLAAHSGEKRESGAYRGKRWDAATLRAGSSFEFVGSC
jgi:GNAT superfamily N-acetyltransferase